MKDKMRSGKYGRLLIPNTRGQLVNEQGDIPKKAAVGERGNEPASFFETSSLGCSDMRWDLPSQVRIIFCREVPVAWISQIVSSVEFQPHLFIMRNMFIEPPHLLTAHLEVTEKG